MRTSIIQTRRSTMALSAKVKLATAAALLVALSNVGSADVLPDGHLKIISFNFQCEFCRPWDPRKGRYGDFFRAEKPDSVGTQEPSGRMIGDVVGMLGGEYQAVGRGRDAGGNGEHSDIIYNAKKWSVAKSNTFQLSAVDAPGSNTFGLKFTRICTYAKFCLNENKEICYWHFNAHYDFSKMEELTNLIVDRICGEVEGGCPNFKYPVFFTADMNQDQGNAGLRIFQDRAQIKDTWVTARGNYADSSTLGATKIDFVLASKGVKVGKTEVMTSTGGMSDHFALFADTCVDNSCFGTPITPSPSSEAPTSPPAGETSTPSAETPTNATALLQPNPGSTDLITEAPTAIPLEGSIAQTPNSETSDSNLKASESDGLSVGSTIGFVFLGMIGVVVVVGVVLQRHKISNLFHGQRQRLHDEEDVQECITPDSTVSPGFKRYQRDNLLVL